MIKKIVLFCLFFSLSATVAYAASDTFTVRTKMGDDTIAPTVPANLTATPVASSQINLSWSASTDDFLLAGYQVFRDSVQIATTTQTNYDDTSLLASTTYTYYVKAFDDVYNISSSSNSVSTTTLPVVATSTTPATTSTSSSSRLGGSGPGNVTLLSLSIQPSLYTAKLTWQTNLFAQFELRWGRTSSYELGFVTNQLFERGNTTSISELQPGTVYEYQLIAFDRNGIQTVLSQGRFKTLDAPDTTPPANVSNLQATVSGDAIHLSWINPTDQDFDHVRIIRNYMFYPTDPYDGYIAYQDKGTFFTDQHALEQKDVQYYTVFSYDKIGNVSSGAIIAVHKNSTGGGGENGEGIATSSAAVSTSTATASSTLHLKFSDFEFVQNDATVQADAIDAQLPFTIRIAYDKLPEHLKAITGVFTSPTDPHATFSFLLKINNDKTYYQATIGALKNTGTYPVTLSVYDYVLEQLSSVHGSITVVQHNASNLFGAPLATNAPPLSKYMLYIILILFLIIVYCFYRTLKELGYGIRIKNDIDRTKLTISILVFFACGASCAYLVSALLHNDASSAADATTQAAVATAQTGIPLGFGSMVMLFAFVVVLVALFLFVVRHSKNK